MRRTTWAKWTAWTIGVAALLAAAQGAAAQQMFKAAVGSEGTSAYLIEPLAGQQSEPEGWKKLAPDNHTNCMLAYYTLEPSKEAAPMTTTSYELPEADYDVSICAIGKGKARLKGAADWVDVQGQGNAFTWTRIGTAGKATRVAVEVAPGDGTFWYAGLLAEGSSLPVVPVDKVLAKLRAGEPVTICLIGDSVTENAKGFRGGSREADGLSAFDNGNPGTMKRYLEKEFGNDVSYISHREPPGWPDDGSLDAIKSMGRVIELDGKTYRDGRVEYDASKKIRLVNMGKGGAASPDAWKRCPETFTEPNDWRKKGNSWNDTYDTKLPPVLRNGVAHYKPDLCIINFGTNDANGSHVGWTAAEYLFHMKVLVTMLQKDLGAAIIVSTPHRWTKGTHQNPHTQMEFADAIRTYAARTGVRLADIYNEYDFAEGDSIHPGNSGHKHIADAYMKALLGQKSEPKNTTRATAAQFRDNGDGTASDTKTGLVWPIDAQAAGGEPMGLEAARKAIEQWNAEKKFGRTAWRLPTEKELLGLTDPSRRPALPEGAPFKNLARVYLTDSVGMALKSGTYYWLVDLHYGMEFFPSRTDGTAALWPVCRGE